MILDRAVERLLAQGGWGASGPETRWVRARLGGLLVVFALLFALLARRAFVLQIRDGDHLRELAEEQSTADLQLLPTRGRILDRNGKQLAASVEVDSVQANPRVKEVYLGH